MFRVWIDDVVVAYVSVDVVDEDIYFRMHLTRLSL
jgi:hypothetical protein